MMRTIILKILSALLSSTATGEHVSPTGTSRIAGCSRNPPIANLLLIVVTITLLRSVATVSLITSKLLLSTLLLTTELLSVPMKQAVSGRRTNSRPRLTCRLMQLVVGEGKLYRIRLSNSGKAITLWRLVGPTNNTTTRSKPHRPHT